MRSLFTKTDAGAPDIIYTQEFRVANGEKYLGYTERSEAVSPETENEFNNDKNVQADPDVPENFDGYLGYTDRKAATKMDNNLDESEKGDYPTFNQNHLELNETEHQELIKNLKLAKKNRSLLWAGVISFSPEFIKEAGLINKQGVVNQKAIKLAVMSAMPGYLEAEGLNNNQTFWWGDIHLNTDHVHVHIAISQKKNTRPMKPNGEPKGMFHTKSIRKLKSSLHHELANAKSRTRLLSLEKGLDYQKGQLITLVRQQVQQKTELQNRLIQLQLTLPQYKDKRRWRASNHSVEFKESRDLAYDLVDYLLQNELKGHYQIFQATSKQLDQLSKQAYGNKITDTIKPRDNRLRERLVNQLFNEIKEAEENPRLYQKDLMALLEEQGPELNQKIMDDEIKRLNKIDPKSAEAKEVRKRLGLRRYYLSRYNHQNTIDDLQERIDHLKELGDQTKLHDFEKFFNERQTLHRLEMTPKYALTEEQRKQLELLKAKYVDPRQLNINNFNAEQIEKRLDQLELEHRLINKNPHDPGIPYMLISPESEKKVFQANKDILKIKQQIKHNNDCLPENDRKKANGPLFQHLKRIYRSMDDPTYHYQPNKIKKELNHQRRQEKRKRSLQRGTLLGQKVIQSFNNILSVTNTRNRKQQVALSKHLDRDDDLEREEQQEERLEQGRER